MRVFILRVMVGLVVVVLVAGPVMASSHADTVALRRDPAVDQTSLYAFRSLENPERVVIAGNYFPFASSQTNFLQALPDPEALYAFHIDTDGDAVEDVTYAVRFRQLKSRMGQVLFGMEPTVNNKDEKLAEKMGSELPAEELTVFQGYPYMFRADVYRIEGPFDGRTRRRDLILRQQKVSIGAEELVVNDSNKRGRFFFGHRDDPEFVGKGMSRLQFRSDEDQYAGMNVFSIVMELPMSEIAGVEDVIGVWGATYRHQIRQLRNGRVRARGKWQQVSRVGMPWVSRLFLPYSFKNQYNSKSPKVDKDLIGKYFLKPAVVEMISERLGFKIPAKGRKDLYEIFMNGIVDVNQFGSGVAAEMLRLNVAIEPPERTSRMGILGGDLSGFPNGRRLGDDVADITFQILGGMLLKTFGVPFEQSSQLVLLGDRVVQNDRDFLVEFPYLAAPHLE